MPSSEPTNDPTKDNRVFDKTNVTLLLAGFAAIAVAAAISLVPERMISSSAGKPALSAGSSQGTSQAARTPNRVWATSAPGRVEPKGGQVQMRAEATGRVMEAYAAAGDEVSKDDLLVQLRDDEAYERLVQARAEVGVRIGERDEEEEKDKAVIARRNAADALAGAERALHKAWMNLDKAYLGRRAGRASDSDVATARQAIETAKADVVAKSDALLLIREKENMPSPTRLDSGLTLARADLRLAEIAYQNTRVRAPVDGTILRFNAKVGEMMTPTSPQPFAVLGDMSAIQITAEVQERDVGKVRIGQGVLVRSSAFEGLEISGKVTEIAPSVSSPGIRSLGPGQQLDTEVLEVKIMLEGKPPVMPGMRVDVFFKNEQRVSSIVRRK